jgi:hypothetical protein
VTSASSGAGARAGGYTDALGIHHPNLPPTGYVQAHARLYLSTSKTDAGTRSATFDPYYVGGAEGFDATASGSENFIVVDDPDRPFQAAASQLSPVDEHKVAWFQLDAGDKSGQAWAATYMRAIHPGSTHYPVGLQKKFRRLYNHFVFKWHPDMPAIGKSGKFGFFDGAPESTPGGQLSLASNSPNVLFTPAFSDSLSPMAPLDKWRFNLQGTVDNAVSGVIDGVDWGSGATGGATVIQYEMLRDVWYSLEIIVTASTSANPGTSGPYARDGSVQIWIAKYDPAAGSFEPSLQLLDATGLEISSGRKNLPDMGRSYMTKIQRYFQWAGTSVNSTYNGVTTGLYAALDYIALSET